MHTFFYVSRVLRYQTFVDAGGTPRMVEQRLKAAHVATIKGGLGEWVETASWPGIVITDEPKGASDKAGTSK